MVGFVMAILGIALVSIVAVISVNYVPIDAFIATKARLIAAEGAKALEGGAVRYMHSVTNSEGLVFLPPNGTLINGLIEPAYAFIPAAPSNMQWRVESANYGGLPAIAICLAPTGTVDEAVARGLQGAKNQLPVAAAFLSSACRATTDSEGLYLTYWVIAQHHT